ncbi:MAG: response regulator [Proteobacteria bacterium]|nr:response regulator [Pseudomonadota bacterium]
MKRLILTVDDSRTIREMISYTLRSANYDVIEAEDGESALHLLNSQRPDLIITDINMPKMDGLTLIKKLREKDTFKSIPILLLTTEYTPEKKAEGRSVGATGWIVKPFDPEKLIQVVSKLCP